MKITCKNIWMTNSYLIEGERGAVVIDPGYKREVILNFLKENEDKERLIILTHGHFDHIGGAEYLRQETGVKIGIGTLDEPALSDNELNCAVSFKRTLPPFSADYLYNDGDIISVGDIEFEVIACPGHTVGGISLLCEGNLFSGTLCLENQWAEQILAAEVFLTLKNQSNGFTLCLTILLYCRVTGSKAP